MIDSQIFAELPHHAALAIGEDMNVCAWSDGAQALLGYTPDEAIGRPCYEVLQAAFPDGKLLCHPACNGDLCFGRCDALFASYCLVLHKQGRQVEVGINPLFLTPERTGPSQTDRAVAVVVLQDISGRRHMPTSLRTLRISTLGHFGISFGKRDLAVSKWERKQALLILKYLVTHFGCAVHRERLIDVLWPKTGERDGWARLKVTMSFLRRQLRNSGIPEGAIETVGKAYVLRRDVTWVDADAFERSATEGAVLHRQRRFEGALICYQIANKLYRGDYLEEVRYVDWCIRERERLRETYLEMLTGMAECHGALGQHAEAVQVCRHALTYDSCRESIHRTLMEYLISLGAIDRAVVQFQRCRSILAQELDIEPSPETQQLYQKILDSGGTGKA